MENFLRVKGNNEVNVWKMNVDRVEECYFFWKVINFFRKNGLFYLFNVKQVDVEGKRRCLEEICLEIWKLICKMENKWIYYTCEVLGCLEGYISVDGLEKVCRIMCVALKEKIYASKEEGNFIKCCINIFIFGGKLQKVFKYCWEYLYFEGNDCKVDRTRKRDNVIDKVVEKEAYVYFILVGYIDNKFVGDIFEYDGLESE